MVIEEYSGTQYRDITELIVNIQRQEFGLDITAEEQPDLSDIKGFYQVDDGNFWVASIDDEVVGTVALLDVGRSNAALRKMFVKKEYRGQERGIAKALLNIAVSWADDKGFKNIHLGTVSTFYAAQRFYEKNGFQRIEKQDLPREMPLVKVDDVFYGRRL